MQRRNIETLFSLNTLLYAIALVIALSLSWNTIKVIERNYSLEQEVSGLEEEIAILELENQNLKFNIEYYATDDFLEVAAKEKFNKKASGERVAVFEKDQFEPSQTALTIESPEPDEQAPDFEENLNAWWNFLFHNQAS